MANNNYKYLIRENLAKLNKEDETIANSFLPEYLNIATATYIKYKDLRLDQGGDMPSECLMKLACFFECHPLELCGSKPDFSNMQRSFQELRTEKFPNYVFSKKFQ